MAFTNIFQKYVFDICQELDFLTTQEYATLGASLRYLYEDRFKCLEKEFKTEQAYKMHIARNSCKNTIKEKKAMHRFDNVLFNRCFCNFYNPQIINLIKISNHIKEHGFKPDFFDLEITNKVYQAINIIQQYQAELEKIEYEKEKQKLKR